MYRVDWARDDGEEGLWRFPTQDEANEAALTVKGTALVSREPGGSVAVYRHGRELDGAEASDAFLRFGHHIEVGISRAGEPDTNIDPGDTTGSGWRPGTPDAWGWRVRNGKDGPTPWIGTYGSRESARAAAEEAQEDDPDLAGLPIVDIGPSDIE